MPLTDLTCSGKISCKAILFKIFSTHQQILWRSSTTEDPSKQFSDSYLAEKCRSNSVAVLGRLAKKLTEKPPRTALTRCPSGIRKRIGTTIKKAILGDPFGDTFVGLHVDSVCRRWHGRNLGSSSYIQQAERCFQCRFIEALSSIFNDEKHVAIIFPKRKDFIISDLKTA